jgi:hypothetical protein
MSVLQRGLSSWKVPPVLSGHLSPARELTFQEMPQLTLQDIPLVLFTSNLVGMTFARSLHYQFQSWYFHQIPFMLYSGGAWGSLPLG